MTQIIEFLQQNAAIFGVLTAIVTVVGFAFTLYKASHDRHVKMLRDQIDQLNKELERRGESDPEAMQAVIEQLNEQVEDAKNREQSLANECSTLKKHGDAKESEFQARELRLHEAQVALTADLEGAREELATRDRKEKTRANLLKTAMRLEGKVWERRVLQGAPKFRPLSERHVAILSVLNLKGGVGKTTVTANLGAVLASRGYKVLLLDLDLQGSLSSLFMPESALAERNKQHLLLRHFLTSAAEHRKFNLLPYCLPIFNGRSAIIPSADSMAYAELNLTMQWLLRLGRRDTRFLLRKALHQRRITRQYDIVLMDCPPLFNTCCVNALAASDYVIIPVTPSTKATERVPLLLERLQSLHRVINPELQVAGVLLNRPRTLPLSPKEKTLWDSMLVRCKDRWKLPVPAFETVIRQTIEVRDSEDEFGPPENGSELHAMFSKLATELERMLPRDCCRTSTPAFGPG